MLREIVWYWFLNVKYYKYMFLVIINDFIGIIVSLMIF